jgi:tetratricopeptide (TPR) repeat protein
VKIFALVTGIAFWLYCCLVVRNLLVGILLFELFHDVQYLAIVWLFNRKRALSAPEQLGRATRAIFGRGQARAVIYVGLVMAYGSLYFMEMLLKNWRPVDSAADATPVWGGILAASGLLHFYYDGFIWKVKEKPTRALLGLEGGRDVQQGGRFWNRSWLRVPAWAEHGLNWAPFAAAIAVFVYTHARPAMSENAARVTLGGTFPNFDLAQANLGMALYAEGDLDGAIDANRHALALPSTDTDQYAQIRNNLGWALVERAEKHLAAGETAAMAPLLQEALALEPAFADILSNKATQSLQAGNAADAITKYRLALLMAPGHPGIQMNLALALGASGQAQEALDVARTALRQSPQDPNLARLVARLQAAAPPP